MNQPVIWGAPHAGRADAARNWLHLLTTARQMLAEQGPARPTTDGLGGTGQGHRVPPVRAQLSLGGVDLHMLAVQLAAALDGPVLLYLSSGELTDADEVEQRIGQSWQDLAELVRRL